MHTMADMFALLDSIQQRDARSAIIIGGGR